MFVYSRILYPRAVQTTPTLGGGRDIFWSEMDEKEIVLESETKKGVIIFMNT